MQEMPTVNDDTGMTGDSLDAKQHHVIWLRGVYPFPVLPLSPRRVRCGLSGFWTVVHIDIMGGQDDSQFFVIDESDQSPAVATIP